MTKSVSALLQLVQRNLSSLTGTSPRPPAMMARRSAGAWAACCGRSESLSFQSAGTRCGAKARRPSRSALHGRGAANDERASLDGGFSTIPEPLPYLGTIGSLSRRRSLAISAGDRSRISPACLAAAHADASDGSAAATWRTGWRWRRPSMAPQICKALTALASTARHGRSAPDRFAPLLLRCCRIAGGGP